MGNELMKSRKKGVTGKGTGERRVRNEEDEIKRGGLRKNELEEMRWEIWKEGSKKTSKDGEEVVVFNTVELSIIHNVALIPLSPPTELYHVTSCSFILFSSRQC